MQTKIDFMITNRDLHRACTQNKYLKLTFCDGSIAGMNCKVGLFKRFERFAKDEHLKTQIANFSPISFHEYITIKSPFIK